MSPATPGGLRYPGPNDPVSGIPTYLQNLAADITAKLGSAGAGLIFASYWGGVSTNGNGYCTLSMPTIRDVRGGFALPVDNNQFLYQLWAPWANPNPDSYIGKAMFWTVRPNLVPGDSNYIVKNGAGIGMACLVWGTPMNPT